MSVDIKRKIIFTKHWEGVKDMIPAGRVFITASDDNRWVVTEMRGKRILKQVVVDRGMLAAMNTPVDWDKEPD